MIKNITKMECKIGDRFFMLLCESDSPLSEVKESLFQFLKEVGQIEDQAKSQIEDVKPPDSSIDDIPKE